MPEAASRERGSKSYKKLRKCRPMVAQGWFLEHLLEVLDHLGDALGVTLASLGATFHDMLTKLVFLRFRCQFAAESLLLKVSAPKLEPLGPKSHARTDFGAPWRRSSARCSVRVMETVANCRELPRPTRNSDQGGGQRLSKRQAI